MSIMFLNKLSLLAVILLQFVFLFSANSAFSQDNTRYPYVIYVPADSIAANIPINSSYGNYRNVQAYNSETRRETERKEPNNLRHLHYYY